MKPGATIWLVGGSAGEYEAHSTWTVDAWTARPLAQRRCDELNKIAADYSEKDRTHGDACPDIMDHSPEANAAFDRWYKKKESMQRTARRKARDPALEIDTSYRVLPIMVMQ